MSGALLATGQPASPGRASGPLALSAEAALAFAARGTPAIFVRAEMDAEDMPAVRASAGIVTTRGGITGDGAVAARVLAKPCLVGTPGLLVRGATLVAPRNTAEGSITLQEGDLVELQVEGLKAELRAGA